MLFAKNPEVPRAWVTPDPAQHKVHAQVEQPLNWDHLKQLGGFLGKAGIGNTYDEIRKMLVLTSGAHIRISASRHTDGFIVDGPRDKRSFITQWVIAWLLRSEAQVYQDPASLDPWTENANGAAYWIGKTVR